MHEEIDKLCCSSHFSPTLMKPFVNFDELLFHLFFFHLWNEFLKLIKEAFHWNYLTNQRVERVPKLMRYRGICKLRKLLFCLHLVVEYLIRDIYYLNEDLDFCWLLICGLNNIHFNLHVLKLYFLCVLFELNIKNLVLKWHKICS